MLGAVARISLWVIVGEVGGREGGEKGGRERGEEERDGGEGGGKGEEGGGERGRGRRGRGGGGREYKELVGNRSQEWNLLVEENSCCSTHHGNRHSKQVRLVWLSKKKGIPCLFEH